MDFTYHVYGIEKGNNGTPHLQGYVEFENKKSLAQLKEACPRAHWEPARGNPKQASDYCKKEGEFTEMGKRGMTAAEKGPPVEL